MARSDRLMRLMDALRRLPAPVTAARLADETGVSPRQLYRDIATLRAGGALIDGEAGVGYSLTEDPALPPQSFSRLEIEALLLAISALRGIGDAELTAAGEDAMARIVATLPESQGRHAMHATLHLFRPVTELPQASVDMALLRQALWDERSLWIDYLDLTGAPSRREILPLGVSYSENHVMLLAFCQLRQDFRTFHIARIQAMQTGETSFRPRRVALVREYVRLRRVRPQPA
ncbi:helix-turn-helix transcriptional regulator [Paracoccus laeviglucosivorans]|uniref:HTH domain-containing protein n=1 Tax=Paracoccus laeviglucosivorans TaxID=1197861 RepID=A0A521AWF7_9RHOB|nr:YafY family protein [Paracoccus laeviglucosivorans]SMO39159.1 HTH domain-containing protein [Paracoccus laeviglucosivorans]